MILQDPGDNEGLCRLMILIKALSITVYVCSFLTMVEFRSSPQECMLNRNI